jgi:trans-aconitate 2-methyltransferase
VDQIFSTATFHWIKDHDRLIRRLAQALKPQGRLVAQCGGKDNIARTQNAMEQVMGEGQFPKVFTGLEDPWNFAAAKTTKARLEAAGFGEVNTWLHEEPTEFDSMDELARFLKTVVLGHHFQRLPESEREHFAAMVAARLAQRGEPIVDYVRLNIFAKREVAA